MSETDWPLRDESERLGFRALVADDDPVSRRRLEVLLGRYGFDVRSAADGDEAWSRFLDWRPELLLLDWQMPRRTGPELCRLVRREASGGRSHIILVTARSEGHDLVVGLDAGADDYVRKPFATSELLARVRSGERLIGLRRALERRVEELEGALARVKRLEDLVPICSYCKKIRDDRDYWHQLEAYITDHTGARFSHGICPDCHERARAEMRGD